MLAMEVLWLSAALRYRPRAALCPISTRGRAARPWQRGLHGHFGQRRTAGGVAGDRSQRRYDPQGDSWEPLCGKRMISIAVRFPGTNNRVSQELPCLLLFAGCPSEEPCSSFESTEGSLLVTEMDLNSHNTITHPLQPSAKPPVTPSSSGLSTTVPPRIYSATGCFIFHPIKTVFSF